MDNKMVPTCFDGDSPVFEENYHKNGHIYWYASDLMRMLGYEEYSPVMKPIQKALQVCMSTNIDTMENFIEERRMVNGKEAKDFRITRFACYLISMNADTKKPNVAKAQIYFAGLTAQIQEFIHSHEDIERVTLRSEITDHEKSLSSTAKEFGIVNYAYFQSEGYRGLYNMPLGRLKMLKGIPKGKPAFDYMGPEELGANIFRITQTEAKIKRENISGQYCLEKASYVVGRNVRKAISEMNGTMPENLEVQEDINKIKSELKRTRKQFEKTDKDKLLEEK
ncbi:MAG: BRO family protein [Sphaerochaetaceae bacterium]